LKSPKYSGIAYLNLMVAQEDSNTIIANKVKNDGASYLLFMKNLR
jgi:hypothetical protein